MGVLGLMEAGADGVERYAAEYLARNSSPSHWLKPLFGNPERLRWFLENSNYESCEPVTATTAMAGYDNHSSWRLRGFDVYGKGNNSL